MYPIQLAAIPNGDAGTHATVNRMVQLARSASVDPEVRQVAAKLVMGAGSNPLTSAKILQQWIERHTQFLPDPSTAEYLVYPGLSLDMILRDGVAQLDCDDVAMLAAALGLSIGFRARFMVAAFHSHNSPYQHVWAELAPMSGAWWLPIDPTRPVQGFEAYPITRGFSQEV